MDKNYNHLINSKDWKDRYNLAENGIALDQLVHDKSWFVRAAVVRQKYALDILVKDESWRVRLEVAKQNYGLEILVNDENEEVRKEAKLRLDTMIVLKEYIKAYITGIKDPYTDNIKGYLGILE